MELNRTPQPPRWPEWLIRRFCDPELGEHLLGDLDELFVRRCASHGPGHARRRYIKEALRGLMQPPLWRKRELDSYMSSPFFPHMLTHHLVATLRNLKRYRTHTLLNIFGLSLGLCFALIIFIKV
ncbi:MAG: permease prefix domain 2-containing transporter, partial [Bacteroidota bacterium]